MHCVMVIRTTHHCVMVTRTAHHCVMVTQDYTSLCDGMHEIVQSVAVEPGTGQPKSRTQKCYFMKRSVSAIRLLHSIRPADSM